MSWFWRIVAACLGTLVTLVLLVWALGVRDRGDSVTPAAVDAVETATLTTQGAYLARAGNCMACHTRRGGPAFAGGRAIATPFGDVLSSNLTPDMQSGLGRWNAADFWRAMHHGRSRDGRLLSPAFPYASYTRLARADSDALFAYLQSLPAVAQANQPQRVRWPFNTQAALAVWRALYFRSARFVPQADKGTEWNRGAYLVQVLGHCNECHAQRNSLGAVDAARPLAGGMMPMQNWYAPSLRSPLEAGVADWAQSEVVEFLSAGRSARGTAIGPMAEVVLHSTQYLSATDRAAIAVYLRGLPQDGRPGGTAAPVTVDAASVRRGAKLYERHCQDCHGVNGQGIAGAYPALAGNRAVQMANATNLVQVLLWGGFSPATAANPRPYGMPPYQVLLSEREMTDVLNTIRNAWGNQAGNLTERDVARYRDPGGR